MEFKNDKGKPWRYEEDGYTVTRSSAWSPPGCHPLGCGIKLYVNDEGILEKVEGDENNPVTHGSLCVRCLTLTDYVYHPDRIIYPMKRDPKDRGKDAWERITYEEAYDIIAEKVAETKKNYGAESIVVFGGTGREGGPLCGTYAQRMLGSPNGCYTQSGYACYVPRVAAAMNILGITYPEIDYAGGLPGRYDDPEYTLPEVIVLWGKEPLPSNGDGLFGHAVIDLMRRGTEIISIDPRVNWLATRATYHLQLRPGTDTALGMAMLNIVISEDLYDHDFVDKWCHGFDELYERVKTISPEEAARICGLDVEDIYGATRMYANARPASIAWGLAVDQKANGSQTGHCIISLEAITGNIDIPGGQLIGDLADKCDAVGIGWEELGEELQNKIIGLEEYPGYIAYLLNSQADLTLEAMETDKPYPLKLGYISSTNLFAGTCAAQPRRWYNAIKKLDFVFCTDVWMTPTAMACADVFLPLSSYAEHDAVVSTHYAASPVTIGAVNKAITVGDCRSDLEVIYELGHKCMPQTWDMYDTVYDFIDDLRLNNKSHFSELREEVVRQREVTYKKYEKGLLREDGQPGFNTPSGRVELYASMFAQFNEDPLPYYEEPQYSPLSTPELLDEYPLVLTTGARVYAYFHSEGKQIPYLRELNPDPLIELHPTTAEAQGIKEGDWVVVENQFGECRLKATITDTIRQDTVHAQHGWWFPEEEAEEPHLYGVWRSNINNLVPHKHIGKMGFGAPFKCLLCKVVKEDQKDEVNA